MGSWIAGARCPGRVGTVAPMTDALDLDAMLQRFRDRAAAVRSRPLPPIAGDERTQFIDGVLTLTVDLRAAE